MTIRQSYTAVVERNRECSGSFASEPYECGWASEAILFVRKLGQPADCAGQQLRVQISPDGMRWCDEGSTLTLSQAEVDFVRVRHFGNWLRLAGDWPAEVSCRLLIALALKE